MLFTACGGGDGSSSSGASAPSALTSVPDGTVNEPIVQPKNSKLPEKPNILLIVIDDYGVDKSPLYSGSGIEIAPTPSIESLAEQGILFTNAWSAPNCMSTRSQIITGQYGFRTGVLNAAPIGVEIDLDWPHLLPKVLRTEGYTTAKIGKYQLSIGGDNAVPTKPIDAGYDYFFGNGAGYPPDRSYKSTDAQGTDPGDALGADYFIPVLARFQRCSYGLEFNSSIGFDNQCGFLESKPPAGNIALRTDPTLTGIAVRKYSTTWDVDEALDWINDQEQPWFMNLSFQAAHAPFVLPPEDLVDDDLVDALKNLNGGVYDAGKLYKATTDPEIDDLGARLAYAAMISALDTEVGRLLSKIDLKNTIVILLGDNGTPSTVVAFDPDSAIREPNQVNELRSKSSYYEGGVNVPFIVAGPIKNPGRKEVGIVSTTDIYSTVLDLAGVDLNEINPPTGPIDGVSFTDVFKEDDSRPRQYNYTEIAHLDIPPGPPLPYNPPVTNIFGVYEGSTIRNDRYKMIWATHYEQSRFVSATNLTGAPRCPPPNGPVCEWRCVDGSESCGYLDRVKQIEFYDLKNDPFETNDLMKGDVSNKEYQMLELLAGELEELLNVEVELPPK